MGFGDVSVLFEHIVKIVLRVRLLTVVSRVHAHNLLRVWRLACDRMRVERSSVAFALELVGDKLRHGDDSRGAGGQSECQK